jgi:hypothetical protein
MKNMFFFIFYFPLKHLIMISVPSFPISSPTGCAGCPSRRCHQRHVRTGHDEGSLRHPWDDTGARVRRDPLVNTGTLVVGADAGCEPHAGPTLELV